MHSNSIGVTRLLTGSALILIFLACGRARSDAENGVDAGRGGSTPAPPGWETGGTAGRTMHGGAGQVEEAGGDAGSNPGGSSNLGGKSNIGGSPSLGDAGADVGEGGAAPGGTGAESGQAGEPSTSTPDGCRVLQSVESFDSCRLDVDCGTKAGSVACTRLASGAWRCQCDWQNPDQYFQVEGAEGGHTCSLTSGLCLEEPDPTERFCATRHEVTSANGCELEQMCATPVPTNTGSGAGIQVVESRVICNRTLDTDFWCQCSRGDAIAEYRLSAETGDGACRPLLEFCDAPTPPVFDEPTTCTDDHSSASSDGCSLNQACTTPKQLTEDVTVHRDEPRFSTCEPSEAEGSRCYCSRPASIFDFEIDTNPSAVSCASSILNCDKDVTIETSGSPECQPTSRTGGADFCEADLECSLSRLLSSRPSSCFGNLGHAPNVGIASSEFLKREPGIMLLRAVAGSALSLGVLFASTRAHAQTTEGALQLGLATPLFTYTSVSLSAEQGGLETDTDTSSTEWGLRQSVTGEIGYGVGEGLVLGALVQLGGASQTIEPEGQEEQESSDFGLFLGPKIDYMFSPGQRVRPFVGAVAGISVASTENGNLETSLTGFDLQGRVGLRAFVADGFSFDPALLVGWGTASGELDVGALSADLSASAFFVGLLVGFSGWVR